MRDQSVVGPGQETNGLYKIVRVKYEECNQIKPTPFFCKIG